MANPQCENGFTKIANEIIDELVKTPLLGAELQICLFVIRKTYGFGKKEDAISLAQFEIAINKSRPTIVKALKHLQLVKMVKLVKVGNSKLSSNVYSFNKNHETWELVKTVELVKGINIAKKENKKIIINNTNLGELVKTVELVKTAKHTKESNIQKKEQPQKNLFLESVLLTPDEITKLKEKFNINFNRAVEILNNYKMQSGKKYKSDYHAMIGWVAKEIKKTPEKSSW